MVSNGSEWNHPIERFNWPVSIDAGLPLLQFLGRLALVAAEFGDQRDHAGIHAGHQPITFPSLVITHPQAAGAAGEIGYVHAR